MASIKRKLSLKSIERKYMIIGVSGVARSGKDLFCSIVKKQLDEKYKLSTTQFALANELKRDCEDFIKTKLGFDVWSDNTEEKNIFRPILVEYGFIKRTQSKGRYWVEKLAKSIQECKSDVIMVSDIRYAHYDLDEVQWLRDEMRGVLVHLSKFEYKSEGGNRIKKFTPPPNEQERINDPKVMASADYRIEWEDRIHDGVRDLIHDDYLNDIVSKFIEHIHPTLKSSLSIDKVGSEMHIG